MSVLDHRVATEADVSDVARLIARSMAQLQNEFLTPDQVAASGAIMGLDRQLVADRTYFLVGIGGRLAGCGGWSDRATLYGGDHSLALRDARRLDPAREPARIRAMFTDPDFKRRGVGRRILQLCEEAAIRAGFSRAELMATLAGEPLYVAAGYVEIERMEARPAGGIAVPLVRMAKRLDA